METDSFSGPETSHPVAYSGTEIIAIADTVNQTIEKRSHFNKITSLMKKRLGATTNKASEK